MKTYTIIIAGALFAVASTLQAVDHTLQEILPGLEAVYTNAQQPSELPEIIQKYYAQAQQKDYSIPFSDFVELYDAICTILNHGSTTQL